jgi:hypothetical protein
MRDDPRLRAQMTIRRNPETGRRQVIVNGQIFPTLTRGDIETEPVVSWAEGDPKVVGYEVTIKCFVPNLDIQDHEVLKEIPLPDTVDPDRFV